MFLNLHPLKWFKAGYSFNYSHRSMIYLKKVIFALLNVLWWIAFICIIYVNNQKTMSIRIRSMFVSYMKLNTVIASDFGKQIISPILVKNQNCSAFFLATAALPVHGLKKVKYLLLLDLLRIYYFWSCPFLYISYTKLWYCNLLITFDPKRVPLRSFTYKCSTIYWWHTESFVSVEVGHLW